MASDSLDPIDGHPIFLDSGGVDIGVDPTEAAAYAGKVGTRLIGTTAERNAYPYAREGLAWYDTTLKRALYHDGTGWVDRTVGVFTPNVLYAASVNYEVPNLSKLEGRARLSGFLTNVGSTTFQGGTAYPLGTVPTGFRPPKTVLRPAAPSPISGGQAWITVLNTGVVQFALQNGGSFAGGTWGIGFEFEWDIA